MVTPVDVLRSALVEKNANATTLAAATAAGVVGVLEKYGEVVSTKEEAEGAFCRRGQTTQPRLVLQIEPSKAAIYLSPVAKCRFYFSLRNLADVKAMCLFIEKIKKLRSVTISPEKPSIKDYGYTLVPHQERPSFTLYPPSYTQDRESIEEIEYSAHTFNSIVEHITYLSQKPFKLIATFPMSLLREIFLYINWWEQPSIPTVSKAWRQAFCQIPHRRFFDKCLMQAMNRMCFAPKGVIPFAPYSLVAYIPKHVKADVRFDVRLGVDNSGSFLCSTNYTYNKSSACLTVESEEIHGKKPLSLGKLNDTMLQLVRGAVVLSQEKGIADWRSILFPYMQASPSDATHEQFSFSKLQAASVRFNGRETRNYGFVQEHSLGAMVSTRELDDLWYIKEFLPLFQAMEGTLEQA